MFRNAETGIQTILALPPVNANQGSSPAFTNAYNMHLTANSFRIRRFSSFPHESLAKYNAFVGAARQANNAVIQEDFIAPIFSHDINVVFERLQPGDQISFFQPSNSNGQHRLFEVIEHAFDRVKFRDVKNDGQEVTINNWRKWLGAVDAPTLLSVKPSVRNGTLHRGSIYNHQTFNEYVLDLEAGGTIINPSDLANPKRIGEYDGVVFAGALREGDRIRTIKPGRDKNGFQTIQYTVSQIGYGFVRLKSGNDSIDFYPEELAKRLLVGVSSVIRSPRPNQESVKKSYPVELLASSDFIFDQSETGSTSAVTPFVAGLIAQRDQGTMDLREYYWLILEQARARRDKDKRPAIQPGTVRVREINNNVGFPGLPGRVSINVFAQSNSSKIYSANIIRSPDNGGLILEIHDVADMESAKAIYENIFESMRASGLERSIFMYSRTFEWKRDTTNPETDTSIHFSAHSILGRLLGVFSAEKRKLILTSPDANSAKDLLWGLSWGNELRAVP